MPCLHAMSCLLEKDRKQRIGAAGFDTFTDNPFFRAIDFAALERKEIEPVFRPSSEKTNFDATYDLEELLLEEAPLEARARRQKPREQLKEDATEQEIRADELHKMIETLFEPFDYTLITPEEAKARASETGRTTPPTGMAITSVVAMSEPQRPRTANREPSQGFDDGASLRIATPNANFASRSRSSTHSPNGSPPLPTVPLEFQLAPSEGRDRAELGRERSYGIPNTEYAVPRSVPDEYHDYLKDSKAIAHFEPPPIPQSTSPAPATTKRRRQTTTAREGGSSGGQYYGGVVSGGGGGAASRNASGSNMAVATAAGGTPGDEPPIPMGSGDERDPKRPSGMLGFLSRKKGRDRSPKARERGVLGKEGARQIVG